MALTTIPKEPLIILDLASCTPRIAAVVNIRDSIHNWRSGTRPIRRIFTQRL